MFTESTSMRLKDHLLFIHVQYYFSLISIKVLLTQKLIKIFLYSVRIRILRTRTVLRLSTFYSEPLTLINRPIINKDLLFLNCHLCMKTRMVIFINFPQYSLTLSHLLWPSPFDPEIDMELPLYTCHYIARMMAIAHVIYIVYRQVPAA